MYLPPFQTFLCENTGIELKKLAEESNLSISATIRNMVVDSLVEKGLDRAYLTAFQRKEWTPSGAKRKFTAKRVNKVVVEAKKEIKSRKKVTGQ